MKILGHNEETTITVPRKVVEEIEKAIRLRAWAKEVETTAKDAIKKAKETLLPLLSAYEIKSYALEGVGTVMSKVSKGTSYSGKKLREALLLQGLSPEEVDHVLLVSSSSWETEYVDFKLPK